VRHPIAGGAITVGYLRISAEIDHGVSERDSGIDDDVDDVVLERPCEWLSQESSSASRQTWRRRG
jgi:hypothetical protein